MCSFPIEVCLVYRFGWVQQITVRMSEVVEKGGRFENFITDGADSAEPFNVAQPATYKVHAEV